MKPRQIALVAGVAIAAFAAAFGIAGAGGGNEPKAAAAAAKPAKVLEVGDANVSAAVNGGGLPKLQVPKKKPKESPTATTTTVAPTTTAPTTTTTAPTTTTTAPTTTTTAPPTNTAPSGGSGGSGPISLGGGED